ncbi:hypothetical protein HK099_001502, partial [Clydaea vesicula]
MPESTSTTFGNNDARSEITNFSLADSKFCSSLLFQLNSLFKNFTYIKTLKDKLENNRFSSISLFLSELRSSFINSNINTNPNEDNQYQDLQTLDNLINLKLNEINFSNLNKFNNDSLT